MGKRIIGPINSCNSYRPRTIIKPSLSLLNKYGVKKIKGEATLYWHMIACV